MHTLDCSTFCYQRGHQKTTWHLHRWSTCKPGLNSYEPKRKINITGCSFCYHTGEITPPQEGHTYTHIHAHTHIHTRTHTYIPIYIYRHIHTHKRMHTQNFYPLFSFLHEMHIWSIPNAFEWFIFGKFFPKPRNTCINERVVIEANNQGGKAMYFLAPNTLIRLKQDIHRRNRTY